MGSSRFSTVACCQCCSCQSQQYLVSRWLIYTPQFQPIVVALSSPDGRHDTLYLSNYSSLNMVDELDRTDEPFEAYLLEILADFQITIPEWKTVKAATPPVVENPDDQRMANAPRVESTMRQAWPTVASNTSPAKVFKT